MPTERSVALYEITLPAYLELQDGHIMEVSNWRKYAASKNITLPGDIEVEGMKDAKGDWHIRIWETPDPPWLGWSPAPGP